ncbi:MAG: hypothetical protein GWN93_05870 [Deltaproteobacteria bacterium]|nr:hypothetical protein [Deltaproteobacteria bacterium]
MSRWRLLAIIEVTDVPAGNTIEPGTVLPVYTENLRECNASTVASS